MTDSTPPKLRWYQFSLRSLLLFVFLFSVVMSGVGYWFRKASAKKYGNQGIERAQVGKLDEGEKGDILLFTREEPFAYRKFAILPKVECPLFPFSLFAPASSPSLNWCRLIVVTPLARLPRIET
jgi:hypothetical protein